MNLKIMCGVEMGIDITWVEKMYTLLLLPLKFEGSDQLITNAFHPHCKAKNVVTLITGYNEKTVNKIKRLSVCWQCTIMN